MYIIEDILIIIVKKSIPANASLNSTDSQSNISSRHDKVSVSSEKNVTIKNIEIESVSESSIGDISESNYFTLEFDPSDPINKTYLNTKAGTPAGNYTVKVKITSDHSLKDAEKEGPSFFI